MAVDPLIDYDWTFSDFVQRIKLLYPQGFRLLSLSMYGNPTQPLISAVWDKRAGPPWKWYLGYAPADFARVNATNVASGFYPTLVSAAGSGADMRISGVFEQLPADQATELTFDQDLGAFGAEVADRAFRGWRIRTGTIHDASGAAPRVTAIWEKNTGNVAWNAFAGLDHDEHQRYFEAEWSGWARLAWVTGSTEGKLLAIYRDDQIGPIGQGFVARHGLTRDGVLSEQKAWLGKGFHAVCFQGYGDGVDRRYAAIFVNNEKPVARTARTTGAPGVKEIDDAVFKAMKESSIRGAALAIASGTRLVLARGYTWAEPDYPDVQPSTVFRLASGSKLLAAIGLHQLIAEGHVSGSDTLPDVLPLKTPAGGMPTHAAYVNCTVDHLLEYDNLLQPRYEGRGTEIASAFQTTLPVTSAQIASFMMTQPALASYDKLNDFAYFLASEVVKKYRHAGSLATAIASRLLKPLSIARIRTSRSLLAAQAPDEARYHSRDLRLAKSVMSPGRPLVPREYGDEHLETMEGSGGLSAAAVDLVRVLAAMSATPYTPLGRPTVDRLLDKASASMPGTNRPGGHGFDDLDRVGQQPSRYRGYKGGLLQTSQSGLVVHSQDISYVIVWNGLHTKANLTPDSGEGSEWYPFFNAVINAARTHLANHADLFPSFGMPSLPRTQANWRWCRHCQGLFFAGDSRGVCPMGGPHERTGSGDYHVMLGEAFAQVESQWRRCGTCQGLIAPAHNKGACPAGGTHDTTGSEDYGILRNSPYDEHQGDWRRCAKCQGLFHAEHGLGRCPAGGSHDKAGSANYRLAYV